MIEGTVSSVTMGRERKRLPIRNIVAAKISNRSVAAELQIGWGSRQRHLQLHVAAPALVFAAQEFRELSELRTVPFHAELQRRLAQAGGALPGSVHSQSAGIVQVLIDTGGFGLQAYPPGIFRFLPQREVGVDQGVGLFFLSDLKIDTP